MQTRPNALTQQAFQTQPLFTQFEALINFHREIIIAASFSTHRLTPSPIFDSEYPCPASLVSSKLSSLSLRALPKQAGQVKPGKIDIELFRWELHGASPWKKPGSARDWRGCFTVQAETPHRLPKTFICRGKLPCPPVFCHQTKVQDGSSLLGCAPWEIV